MLKRVSFIFSLLLACIAVFGLFAAPNPSQASSANFTDARDGEIYPYVEVNGLYWMAANLRFASAGADCFEDDPQNCEKFGRLYPLEDIGEACPKGWHLPSPKDWKSLRQAMKSKKADAIIATGVWEGKDFAGASNSLGLSILPAGRKDAKTPSWRDSPYGELGISASYWLDDPDFEEHWHIRWGKSHTHKHGDLREQNRKFSIRCVCESLPHVD